MLIKQKNNKEYLQQVNGLNASAIVSIANSKGEITFTNEKFSEVSGYSKEELLGANHRIVNSGYHTKDFFKEMWETISRGITWQGEVCNRKKDGSIYWVSTVITSSQNEFGETEFMSIRFDITKQKNDNGKLNQLIKGLNDSAIVSIANSKGEITFTNEKFSEVSGYSKEELLGANHRIVNSGYHTKDFFKEMWETISRGITWQGEVCNRKKDGSIYWVSTVITSSQNEFDETEYMSIRFDISRIKLIEKQLIQNSKLAYMGEMSAGVAHEINNPLSIIMSAVKILPRSLNNAEKFESLITKITKSGDRISRIVSSLKKFSHSSNFSNYKEVDLSNIVNEVHSIMESRLNDTNTTVTFNLKANVIIFCDEVEIEQVLINLINNSIDAIKNNTDKWVKVEVFDDGEYAFLNVKDSGTGMSDKIAEKLFNPFFTTKEIGEGTGLGLSISKGIIDSHKGSIRIVPNNFNTCFEIKIAKVISKQVA